MKKKGIITLAICAALMCMNITGCGASVNECDEVIEGVLNNSFSFERQAKFDKLKGQGNFEKAVNNRITAALEQGDLEEAVSIITGLSHHDYLVDSEVKLLNTYAEDKIYSCGDLEAFAVLLNGFEKSGSLNYKMFDNQTVKAFLQEYATPVICEDGVGGYYDDKHQEYTDDKYQYSPLDGKRVETAEIGTYEQKTSHRLCGDLMVTIFEKTWAGTDENDPNNMPQANLDYKGETISGNYRNIRDFLEIAETGNTYVVNSPDGYYPYALAVGEKDFIYVLRDDYFEINNPQK